MDSLQNYDFTAAASGAESPISAPGRLIYYYSGSAGGADNTLVVRAGNTGAKFLLKPGQSFKLPAEAKEIDTWYISNYSKTAPIIGVLQIGDGDFKDNRISGSVEVVDGGKNRTLSNQSYIASVGVGAVAAQYSYVQLWNPIGSGKNIIVEALMVTTTTAGAATIGFMNSPLTNAATQPPLAKKTGGAVASMQGWTQSSANAYLANNQMYGVYTTANSAIEKKFAEPLVITPGWGVVVRGNLNQDIIGIFEYFEENQ